MIPLLGLVIGFVGGFVALLVGGFFASLVCGWLVAWAIATFQWWREQGFRALVFGSLALVVQIAGIAFIVAFLVSSVSWLLDANSVSAVAGRVAGWSLLLAMMSFLGCLWVGMPLLVPEQEE